MATIKKGLLIFFISTCCFAFSQVNQQIPAVLCNKSIVGYWHTWQNASAPFIKLRDVPCYYNVINLAFLEPTTPGDYNMRLTIEENLETTDEVIADIKILKARGIKVMASIGGANGTVALLNSTDKTKFINSIQAIIEKFGLEGLDIDIEGGIKLDAGDTDFKAPKSPRLVNLIDAIKTIKAKNGDNFWITMAPELDYVQGGYASYSGHWGAYLPILYSLRDIMAYIHVQYYNTGGTIAPDGNNYTQGNADFIVAMTDMLLSGFNVGSQAFPALDPQQVAFGVPAINGAAGSGYMAMTEVVKALDYLTKGTAFGGKYKLTKSFPDLRGIMTWSVNWDKSASYQFGKTFSNYFCGSTNLCEQASIEHVENIYSVQLYPNPAADKLIISSNKPITLIEVYNMSGTLIKSINNPGTAFDVKDLKQGVYYLRSYAANEVIINKLLKL